MSLKAPSTFLVGQTYKLAALPFASSAPSPGSRAHCTLSCTTLMLHMCVCPVALTVHSPSRVCVGPLCMRKSQSPRSSALWLDRGQFACSHSHTWLMLHSLQVAHPCTCAQQHSFFCMLQPVCQYLKVSPAPHILQVGHPMCIFISAPLSTHQQVLWHFANSVLSAGGGALLSHSPVCV